MSIAISEEHASLAEAADRFLRTHCSLDVARADLDSQHETLPKFWSDLSALGWIGLHLREADGGQGYGLSELGVIVEQMGRVAAPGRPRVPGRRRRFRPVQPCLHRSSLDAQSRRPSLADLS